MLKVINPEYAKIEMVETTQNGALEFANGVLDNMSIRDHPDVIAAEKQLYANLGGARKGDLDRSEVILDAVMPSDETLWNCHGNDVPGVIQPIKDMLAYRHNSVLNEARLG